MVKMESLKFLQQLLLINWVIAPLLGIWVLVKVGLLATILVLGLRQADLARI